MQYNILKIINIYYFIVGYKSYKYELKFDRNLICIHLT